MVVQMNSSDPLLESPRWRDARLQVCGFTLADYKLGNVVSCATQEHGARVHIHHHPPGPEVGDGLWTSSPGVVIAIRMADCVPILLWDPQAPAVAAIHAGWRGTAKNIVGNAVAKGAALGVLPRRLRAAIGPCIGLCCFEVGDEVVEALRAADLGDSDIQVQAGPRGRTHVNLRSANRVLLKRAGLIDSNIDDVGSCTYCTADRYQSYRRDGASSGRMHGLIALARGALLLCFALVVAQGCSDGRRPEPTEVSFAERADQAQSMTQSGDLDAAETLLRALLNERPDDAHLRAVLARNLHNQRRFTDAQVQGRLALGVDPEFWQAAYQLAYSSAAEGDLDQSIRWLQLALRAGVITAREVASDPDLLALQEDHRFSFYLATGILSRDEKDVLALVQPSSVRVGEMATVTVTAISLNRPLMSPREPVELRLVRPFPVGFIAPVSRRETFSTGEDRDREFTQRTFQYTFEVLRSGAMQLGPFEVRQGDAVQWTDPLILKVQANPEHGSGPTQSSGVAVQRFFASPSVVDRDLQAAHEQQGGVVVKLDPLSDLPIESPWSDGANTDSRFFQFRSASITQLPGSLPRRQPRVFRSILVQRGTEGLSHVAELRLARPQD